MKKTLTCVDDLYVISEEMRRAYYKLFCRDSYIVRNFSVERKEEVCPKSIGTSQFLTMVYAGGLHYNRWKVLSEIATVLKAINQTSDIKCCLKIYSSQVISSDIISQMEIDGASEFLGAVAASQIADIYAEADILLHVESFEEKAIASTKYSFSTKIPEYLSANKCVLAVGPAEVASIHYLADFACVVSDNDELFYTLSNLLNDDEYRKVIQNNCGEQYEKDFSRKKQEECLDRIVSIS